MLSQTDRSADQMPADIVRTETVLSKLPIHHLAKKGTVEIAITQYDAHGAIDLQWEVSYNNRYGPSRQLAYKLDTLVVNRCIDTLERPLPKLIRLGSLRDICSTLGLTVSGRTQTEIKHALHQNAGAYITAKLHYTDRDGMERCLETGFTRYSVIVTGQRLPNGCRADAVYLALNEPYWEVLQHAPVRPLDYEYLTTLAPSAQRFYELLSYQMFAALKYRRPEATMRYSTYCTFAPQRYLDYDRVKKQMYKVHQPHLQSGYLAEVRTERLRGDQEAPDWLLKYTPGRKARAEYHAFTGQIDQSGPAFQVAAGGDDPPGNALSEGPVETLDGIPVSTDAPASGVSRPDSASLMPEPRPQDDTAAQATRLIQDFRQRVHGVTAVPPQAKEIEHATRLIETHGQDFATFFVPFACHTARRSDFRPQVFGGLMRYEGQALAAYRQRQAKMAREAAEAAEAREARLRQAYEQERLAQLTVFRDGLSPEVQTALETQVYEELMAAERIPRSVLGPRLKAELYDRLAVQAGVPTYEAWLRQREETSHR